MYKIAILVPIYNRLDITKQGLLSLFNALSYYKDNGSGLSELDVIVVDDGSTDGSSEFVTNKYPDIYLLRHSEGGLWWSGAINLGAKFAVEVLKSDFVLLWNDDVVCESEYFIEIDNSIKNEPETIIGSYIYDYKTKKLWSKLLKFNAITGISFRVDSVRSKDSKFSFFWLTGMGSLIPSTVIAKLGYWDNINFPQYAADFDFTLRASKAGVEIIANPKMVLYNRTEFSSYMGHSIKTFLKSLNPKNLKSRYNIKIKIQMYKMHCVGPLWIITFFFSYLKYFFKIIFLPKKVNI